MKLAVVCANGKVGQLVVAEAKKRGAEVTAIVRGENKSAADAAIVKDVFDVTAEDLAGFDAVVDAFGAWTPDTIHGIGDAIIHLGTALKGTDTRFVVVGGAGSLFVNPEHTATVDMGPDFPADWKPLSDSHGRGLAWLRQQNDLKWTYISPAADFQAEGAATGEYTLAGEEFTLNSKGESTISYADYALAMVDELFAAQPHIQQRISVVSK